MTKPIRTRTIVTNISAVDNALIIESISLCQENEASRDLTFRLACMDFDTLY